MTTHVNVKLQLRTCTRAFTHNAHMRRIDIQAHIHAWTRLHMAPAPRLALTVGCQNSQSGKMDPDPRSFDSYGRGKPRFWGFEPPILKW